jgi:hypothetical protein
VPNLACQSQVCYYDSSIKPKWIYINPEETRQEAVACADFGLCDQAPHLSRQGA